jgi:hypothetical protein
MSGELSTLAKGWVEATAAQVAREMGGLQEAMLERVDHLAAELAGAPPDELGEVEGVQAYAEAYLVEAGRLLEELAERLDEGLAERLQPLVEQAEAAGAEGVEALVAVARWRTNARHYLTFVAQYLAGYVQGGGVALGLLLEMPEGLVERAVVTSIVRHRLMFAADRAELAATRWAEEVGAELVTVARALEGASAGGGASAGAAAGDGGNAERLQRLLALAEEHAIRIKKVPSNPSDRYLDRMEEQLTAAVEKRVAAREAADKRKERLAELMGFADTLGVKVRKVPSNPSDGWLDKMEAKLVEVAQKKGVPLPGTVEPPSEEELLSTPLAAPPRPADKQQTHTGMSPAERKKRVREMVAKADKAKLDLGTVPEEPTDEWVETTEKQLESALAKRKAERKAAREKKKREREQRIQRLKDMAAEAGIELGSVPKFPTEDWLARMEMKVASARMPEESEDIEDNRAERLKAVLAKAEEEGIDLGEVPPDPDRLWLSWAEGRVDDAGSAEELIAAGEDPDQPPAARPRLVFEEGTVQEKMWMMEEGELTVGRARGNDIQIRDDSGVSRRHCTVFEKDGAFFVRDNGSTKGTLLDGQLITDDTPVESGARITVGDTVIVFRA